MWTDDEAKPCTGPLKTGSATFWCPLQICWERTPKACQSTHAWKKNIRAAAQQRQQRKALKCNGQSCDDLAE